LFCTAHRHSGAVVRTKHKCRLKIMQIVHPATCRRMEKSCTWFLHPRNTYVRHAPCKMQQCDNGMRMDRCVHKFLKRTCIAPHKTPIDFMRSVWLHEGSSAFNLAVIALTNVWYLLVSPTGLCAGTGFVWKGFAWILLSLPPAAPAGAPLFPLTGWVSPVGIAVRGTLWELRAVEIWAEEWASSWLCWSDTSCGSVKPAHAHSHSSNLRNPPRKNIHS